MQVFPGENTILAWRAPIPKDIQEMFVSREKPNNPISINDCELVAAIIALIVITDFLGKEKTRYSVFKIWVDNMSSLSWMLRRSARPDLASKLLLVLGERLATWEFQLSQGHVPGVENCQADVASRSYGKTMRGRIMSLCWMSD